MSVLSAKSERPRLPIKWLPESALEWLAEAAALGVLLFWVFYLATYWSDLPDEVPKGFGFGGQPRGSASRSFLWLLPGVGIVSYCGLTLLSRLTHLHNFPEWGIHLTQVTTTYCGWPLAAPGKACR